jgi:hypothetical protein
VSFIPIFSQQLEMRNLTCRDATAKKARKIKIFIQSLLWVFVCVFVHQSEIMCLCLWSNVCVCVCVCVCEREWVSEREREIERERMFCATIMFSIFLVAPTRKCCVLRKWKENSNIHLCLPVDQSRVDPKVAFKI